MLCGSVYASEQRRPIEADVQSEAVSADIHTSGISEGLLMWSYTLDTFQLLEHLRSASSHFVSCRRDQFMHFETTLQFETKYSKYDQGCLLTLTKMVQIQMHPLTSALSTTKQDSAILEECNFMTGRIYLFMYLFRRILLSRYCSLFWGGLYQLQGEDASEHYYC